jgi:glycosyltransferase involved in cell wall biosynthesis
MRILYIFQDEYPWDVRVEKITTSLGSAHAVHLLCRNRGTLPAEEQLGQLSVHRVGGRGLAAISGFPAFFSPWWIRAGLSIIRSQGDRPADRQGSAALSAGADPEEAHGRAGHFRHGGRLSRHDRGHLALQGPGVIADYLIRNPRFLRTMENLALPRVDETWVVSAASRARVMAKAGPGSRVRVIGNTPTIDILDMKPQPDQGSLAMVYTGFIDATRGLDTVVRAVSLARRAGLPATLDVVGTGAALEDIEKLVAELGLDEFVTFHGWCTQAQLRSVIAACSIGVVPHRVTAHTSTTLPNKIFDYMALAKPVIVSNARALEDVVTEAGCGLVFQDGDPESLLSCLRRLQARETREGMGVRPPARTGAAELVAGRSRPARGGARLSGNPLRGSRITARAGRPRPSR